MKKGLLVIGLLLASIFAAAARESNIPLLSIEGIEWTSEEITFIKQLRCHE